MSEQDRRKQLRTSDLAHFIIGSTNPGELGKTKLFKTMWWADVLHYRRYGKTVSGLSAYVRMPKGPVPRNIYPILDGLKAGGKILERQVNLGDAVRHEFIAIAPADPDRFTSREIQSIYRAIEAVRPLTAAQASEMTHDPRLARVGGRRGYARSRRRRHSRRCDAGGYGIGFEAQG